MLVLVSDPFAQAVEDARQRLQRQEGRSISTRELARRAGVSPSTLAYNLSDKPRTRRIDRELIDALAAVLPVSAEELMHAAGLAAGYTVAEDLPDDLGTAVVRYMGSKQVSASEKAALLAQLAEIVAEEMRKAAERNRNGR